MQLRESSPQGSITSSHHLPTPLELNVEGQWGEIFAASPIAIPMQGWTQWIHSDVYSQLATLPECMFKIGDRQSEEKRGNGDRRALCSATRSLDAGCGVIRNRGVWRLWRSASTLTQPFRPDGNVFCWWRQYYKHTYCFTCTSGPYLKIFLNIDIEVTWSGIELGTEWRDTGIDKECYSSRNHWGLIILIQALFNAKGAYKWIINTHLHSDAATNI
jgi:hypothetical protein